MAGRGIQIHAAGGRRGPFDIGARGQCARQGQCPGGPYPERFFRGGDLNGDLRRFQRLQFLFRQLIFCQLIFRCLCLVRVRFFFRTCRFRRIEFFRLFGLSSVGLCQPFGSFLCRVLSLFGFLLRRNLFRLVVLFPAVRFIRFIFRNGYLFFRSRIFLCLFRYDLCSGLRGHQLR